MKVLLSILIALGLFATPTVSQTAKAAASDDTQAIRDIERDFLTMERTTNTGLLDRILADDYVSIAPHGLGPTKAELLKTLRPKDGQPPPYTVETSDMRIYILGETAVAAFTKVYTAKENGNVAHEDNTHVFKKEAGAWKLKLSRTSMTQKED